MEFIIATNNSGKLREIRRILEPLGHTALGLNEAALSVEVEETGTTYAENARLKARAACEAAGRPAIGDDSGLEVDILSGDPGVRSARFAGEHATDEENNKKLLGLMERTPYAGRGAEFVCAMVLVMPDGSELEAEGRCRGTIGFTQMGEKGFGYDPLFLCDGKSFGDMEDAEKDAVSHRGKAIQALVAQFGQLGL